MPAEWTLPGAFPVGPGVFRVPLPLPHDALKAVNTYVLDEPGGLVMIDSGWALAEARSALEDALAALGHDLSAITRFLMTHVHRDHYTQAVQIRRVLGTRISIGVGEQPSIDAYLDPARSRLQTQLAAAAEHGAQTVVQRLEAVNREEIPPGLWAEPDDWITDDAVIRVGSRMLRAIRTPGHTRGHLVFHDSQAGVLFAGDHVLPHITPSIGFEPAPAPQPLARYLDSLDLVRRLPDAELLPAHGPVGGSVHRRVDELLHHHRVRLELCGDAVAAGATSAYEVALRLTWTRRESSFVDLDPFNQLLAVLETAAHLDVLVRDGRLRRTHAEQMYTYAQSVSA